MRLRVSDDFGNGKDSHATIGTGVPPLEPFLAQMGAAGWRGDRPHRQPHGVAQFRLAFRNPREPAGAR